jgi:transcriptional regulator with XRE-family HTH domain/tetratricopeptide (TPR) repeat protein
MATVQPPAFGELLKHYRTATGLTQEALAERARLSVRGISDLERGVNRRPRRETVDLLAAVLGLSAQERAMFAAAAGGATVSISPPPGRAGGSGSSVLRKEPAPPDSRHALPFVGRRRELALLDQHLAISSQELLAGGTPPVLLFAGEPGIGKSRLLYEAHLRAEEAGWCVLYGGCQRRGGQDLYAPVLGALQSHIRGQLAVHLRRDLQGCAWLVRLLPELAEGPIEPLPSWTLSPAQERRFTFEAVVRFLSNVAQQGTHGAGVGTLLLLDDLQWAAADALDLLRTLAHAATEEPLRVVGAYRDTEVRPDDPVGGTLADLAQARLATQCLLDPLAPAEAADLLTSLLAAEAQQEAHHGTATARVPRDRLLQRAGGVPFFLVSWAQALRRGTLEGSPHGGVAADDVPWDLAQGVRQRVASLPEAARELLGVAAVAGRVVSQSVLAAVVARPEREVVEALEAACRIRLLEEAAGDTRVGRGYRFMHDVIREVVEADLGAARRTLQHRQVADALAGQPGEPPVEELAYHYTHGEAWAKALEYLVKAGDKAAATYANQSALDLYARALALCSQLGDASLATAAVVAQRRGDLNLGLGNIGDAMGDFDGMLVAARRQGNRHLEGLALSRRGMCEFWNTDLAAAEQTLRAALTVGNEGFDDVRFSASLWLGGLLTATTDRLAEGLDILLPLEELARRVDDPWQQFWWTAFTGNTINWTGRYDEALALLAGWRDVASRHMFTLVATWWHEALLQGSKGDYGVAFALLEQVLATCERVGEPLWRARALNLMGWLCGELQDPTRAMGWNTLGVQAALELAVPDLEIESNARLNLGDNLLALGRLEEAEQQFAKVDPVVRHPRPQDHVSLLRYSQHHYHTLVFAT